MDRRWPIEHPRIGGALLLSIGCGLGYAAVYMPLQAARHHEGEVSLHVTSTVFAVCGIALGLFMLLFGGRGRAWMLTEVDGGQKLKPAGMAFAVLVLLAGLAVYSTLDWLVFGYGYH